MTSVHAPQFADNYWADFEGMFSTSNFFVEDELVVEVMENSIECLKELMSISASPSLKKKQPIQWLSSLLRSLFVEAARGGNKWL